MFRGKLLFWVLVCCVLRCPQRAAAQDPPSPRQVAALASADDVGISPDGSQLVYVLRTHQPKRDAQPGDDDRSGGWEVQQQLYLVDAAGGEPRQLTTADGKASSPRWSAEGSHIAFLRTRDDKVEINVIRPDGGEAKHVETPGLEPKKLEWSPFMGQIAFLAEVPRTEAEKADFWRSGRAVVESGRHRPSAVYVVPAAGGRTRRVTQEGYHVVDFAWSPDGESLAVVAAPSSSPYDELCRCSLRIVSVESGQTVRVLDAGPAAIQQPAWSPDGASVAYLMAQGTLSLMNALKVAAVDGSQIIDVAGTMDATLVAFVWAADGRSLIGHIAERTRSRLYRLPRGGGPPAALFWEGRVIHPGPITADERVRRLACLTSDATNPNDPTVIFLDEQGWGRAAQLNPQLSDWALGHQRLVRWRSRDGLEIEGLLLVTPVPPKDRPPPLVVLPHGGPDSVSTASFHALGQLLAGQGFSVFYPNYRGSIGYGRAFYAANRGRLGEVEFMDMESGVDHLIAEGLADKERLFYGGWSWGGYLAAWTIGHTDRYRAAVIGAGVSDAYAGYSLTDINHGVSAEWEFLGNPWTKPENFDRASPVRFIRNVRTPTLILHGEDDERVPIAQSRILHRALSDLGATTEFVRYPGEGHLPREPAHLADIYFRWMEWYHTHMPK